jgi:hypothetical protein
MLNLVNPPQFDPEVYAKIAMSDLVVYSMHFLHTQGIAITSEDIVSACFTLFPRRFSLVKYPYWPDSAVVARRWGDCRRKGFIVGSVANGFKLTPKGFRFAEKVERALGSPAQAFGRAHPIELRTRAGRFVRAMESSDAFKDYKKHGRNARFNEFEFRSMLMCTLESTHETLKRNLDQFRDHAQLAGRADLTAFLDLCEHRYAGLLVPPAKRTVARKARRGRGKK